MRVLMLGNAPWAQSGYGIQTRLFAEMLDRSGHEVIIVTNYGLGGGMIRMGNIRVFGQGYDGFGNDTLIPHTISTDPDVVWVLYDIYVFNPDVLSRARVTSWCPVDHKPVPGPVLEHLQYCAHTVAMSRFGEQELKARGLNPYYVPHGVETDIYKPLENRGALRAQMDLPEDAFVVATVAANKGYPPRKNWDRLIKAWSIYQRSNPKAIWLMHTNPRAVHGGLDIHAAMAAYGVPPSSVKLVDEYRYAMGQYTTAQMNQLYNAADVFWLPSAGEGFGIPVVEAQAAGCPVIVTDFSAQSELAGPGYKIAIDPVDELVITTQNSEQAYPAVSKMVRGLEWAAEMKGNEKLRADSRAFALDYDYQTVFGKYMLPVMTEIANGYKSVRKRKELVIIPAGIRGQLDLSTDVIAPKRKDAPDALQWGGAPMRLGGDMSDKAKALIDFGHVPAPIEAKPVSESTPDVSVLMPAYKSEKTIIPAIRSVLEQPFVSLELLVCHDEGGDNTAHILSGWHEKRLKVFKGSGEGIAVALNQIASHARGRYVIRLDSDDTFAARAPAKMVKALDANPGTGFVYGCVQYHGESNQKFVPGPFNADEFWLHNASLYPVMYRREALEKCHYRTLLRVNGRSYDMEDWDFVLQLISHQFLGLALPDVLVLNYNYNASGIDHERSVHTEAMMALFRARWPRLGAIKA